MKSISLNFAKTSATFILLTFISSIGLSQQSRRVKELDAWPRGTSPQEIGEKVAERLASMPYQNFPNRAEPPKHIIYPEVATWYGALTFSALSGDHELSQRLIHRFDP